MRTSRTTWLTKPEGDSKISSGTFGYVNARIRQRAYDLVVREFKASGISQATLARRWGKAPEIVSRFLARPANWELNTLAEALFAIRGAVPSFSVDHVDAQDRPSWLRHAQIIQYQPRATSEMRTMELLREAS